MNERRSFDAVVDGQFLWIEFAGMNKRGLTLMMGALADKNRTRESIEEAVRKVVLLTGQPGRVVAMGEPGSFVA